MKSKLKKSLSLLLALVMCLSVMSVGAFAAETHTVTFNLTDDVGRLLLVDVDANYNEGNPYTNVYGTWNNGQYEAANTRVAFTQTVTSGGLATKPTYNPYYNYNVIQPNNGNPKQFTADDSGAYTFDGWATQDGKLYDFSTPVEEDLTLIPRFSASGATITISNEDELLNFAEEVRLGRRFNNGHGNRQTVQLSGDITLSDKWTPISKNFQGNFDGNNHSISGLNVTETDKEVGFFKVVGSSNTVSNLTLIAPKVSSTSSLVGALAGEMNATTVTNCHVTGAMDISGTTNVGGLFGHVTNGATITNCTVVGSENAKVAGTDSDARPVGGLIGNNDGEATLTNCSVSGVTVVGNRKIGGLIGQAAKITATGISVSEVELQSKADIEYGENLTMGGLVGVFASTYANSSISGTVSNVTMTGPASIAADNYVMGLVSGGTNGAATVNAAETAMKDAGMTFDVTVSGTNTCTVPNESTYAGINGVAAAQTALWSGSGTEAAPYQIATEDDLAKLANKVNGGESYSGVYFKLTSDITLSGAWTPIGNSKRTTAASVYGTATTLGANPYFAGTFDGDGKTISGLTNTGYTPATEKLDKDGNYVFGLFGVVGNGAVLKNVKLAGVNIDTTAGQAKGDSVGALAGYSFGDLTVSGVTVNGTVAGHDAVGAIIGRIYQGKLAGEKTVSLTNCSATATVRGDGAVGSKVSGLFGFIADHDSGYPLNLTVTGNTFAGTASGGDFNSPILCLNTTLQALSATSISNNKHGTLDTEYTSATANDATMGTYVDVATNFAGMTDEAVVNEIGETTGVVVITPTEPVTDTAYAAEKVSDANNNPVVTKYEVKVAETAPAVTDAVATEAPISSVNTTSVIDKAKTSASTAISVGGTNTIELFVKADDSNSSSDSDTLTYEVDPYAIVNSDTSNPVKLSNSDLNEGASFTFKVAAPEGATVVDVTHSWKADETRSAGSETFKNRPVVNGQVEVTLTHFSGLEVTTVSTGAAYSGNAWETNFVNYNFGNAQDSLYMNVVLWINTNQGGTDQVGVSTGKIKAQFMNLNAESDYLDQLPSYGDSDTDTAALDAASATALAANGYYFYKSGSYYVVRFKVFPYQISETISVQVYDGNTQKALYENRGSRPSGSNWSGVKLYSLSGNSYSVSMRTWLESFSSTDSDYSIAVAVLNYGTVAESIWDKYGNKKS